jgi:hypothetical protein
MVLGTIEGHPQGVRKDPPDGQGAVLCQTLQDLQVYPIERTRAQRIKEVASLRVPGELLHTEQGRGILGALGWLAMALGLQKRRRWGEKDTKGTERGVWDGVTGVGPLLAMARPVSEPSGPEGLELIEA